MPEITLSPSRAGELLSARISAGDKTPMFWHGAPGVGKTETAEAVALALGMDVCTVIAVTCDPTDFGMPVIETAEDGSKWLAWSQPGFLPRAGCAPTLVFWDELTRAPMMVQNAVMRMILTGRIGEYRLPDNCFQLAAGNRVGDGGGTQRLNSALANRFVHVNITADLDSWCRWAAGAGMHPLVIALMRWRPELLCEFSKDSDAFPTPRSWSYVSDTLWAGERTRGGRWERDLELAQIAGAVGDAAAGQAIAYLELYRQLPSIDAILLSPDDAPVPGEVSALYAVSAALATRADDSNFARIMRYLDRLPLEYSVFTVRDATIRNPGLCSTAEFTRWAVDHRDIL